ncbi:hypothetical protein AAG570_000659 [Ranatra chinensis]|uniref:Protein CDV3 homolog n=1 Tax=Ranatra chinensis TaxID=642074 RepID=A0ABD0ZKZ8_9HEMI
MADLDDFFAKKDRKKAKSKKFTTADEIAKKLEDTGRRSEKLKKDKSLSSQSTGQETNERGNAIQDEDEWRDFEEEKKDYTGLKIQNLNLGDDDYDGNNSGGYSGDDDVVLEENEAGEMVPKKKNQGPWRVVATEEPPQQPEPPPQVAPKREEGGGGGGGGVFEEVKNSKSHTARYEPPMMRNSNRLALGNKYGALNSDQS